MNHPGLRLLRCMKEQMRHHAKKLAAGRKG